MTTTAPEEPLQRSRLIEIVKAHSFQTGRDVKLASGQTSSFYFNMKPTMLHPEGAYLIGSLVLDRIGAMSVEFVGGLEMGAVPLATAVAVVSHHRGTPIAAFFVRKQAKEHGTQALIEGLGDGETIAGRSVVVVEDVTTTGGSALRAVEAVRNNGGRVACVVTIVDRLEGALEAFDRADVEFEPLLTIDDFR